MKDIARETFYGCKSLKNVSFGKSIEEIGTSAFSGCDSLQSANLGDKVETIGTYAFNGCYALKSVNISDKVKVIEPNTFSNCSSLKSVTGFAAVDSIKQYAFQYCYSLRDITIPATAKYIGTYAFYNAGLKKLTIADSDTPLSLVHYGSNGSNESPFKGCPIDTLYWGRDITHVNRKDYYAPFNTSLKEVVISDQVKDIARETFYGCKSLKNVSFGKNIEEIGTSAFSGCDALETLKANWTMPIETPDNTFSNTVYKNAKLYIPGGTMAAYQATGCWNKFQSIMPVQYKVTVDVTTGGSVRVNGMEAVSNKAENYWIDRETEVTFDVVADEDNNLLSLTVNGEDVKEQLVDGRFTVASLEDDVTLTAMFVSLPQYSVTASVVTLADGEAGTGGTATVSNNTVISGHSTTVTITSYEGYELKSVIVNGEDMTSEVADGVLTLGNITEEMNVAVTFQKQKFTITATDCEHGSIGLSATEVEWGDDVTVTVIPDKEYELASLFVNGEDVTAKVFGNKYVVGDIKNNIVVSATFSPTFVMIELTDDGESTYCSDHHLDFSRNLNISAYIASGYYPQTGYVLLTRVLEVPAGTGIVVKGDAGTYKVPFGESSAYYLNLLVGNVEPKSVEPTEGNYANLILTMGDDGLGFCHFSTPFDLDANSAYLQLPTNLVVSESFVKMAYEEDADAIRAAKATTSDIEVYDLSGRKIVAPQRGLNIIRHSDGTSKKVMLK